MTIGEALNVSATGFIVVLIILALLACIIVVLSKAIRLFDRDNSKKVSNDEKKISVPVSEPAKATAVESTQTVQIPTGLELYKTSEKTAATIMAIVSHESGIPLERLAFSSIRLVDDLELYKTDDKTAATIMAIVSHQSGIPLDRLIFKSIKLIEK